MSAQEHFWASVLSQQERRKLGTGGSGWKPFVSHCSLLCVHPQILTTFSGIWFFSLLLVSTSSAFLHCSKENSFLFARSHPPCPMMQVLFYYHFAITKQCIQVQELTQGHTNLQTCILVTFIFGCPKSRSNFICLNLEFDNILVNTDHMKLGVFTCL